MIYLHGNNFYCDNIYACRHWVEITIRTYKYLFTIFSVTGNIILIYFASEHLHMLAVEEFFWLYVHKQFLIDMVHLFCGSYIYTYWQGSVFCGNYLGYFGQPTIGKAVFSLYRQNWPCSGMLYSLPLPPLKAFIVEQSGVLFRAEILFVAQFTSTGGQP